MVEERAREKKRDGIVSRGLDFVYVHISSVIRGLQCEPKSHLIFWRDQSSCLDKIQKPQNEFLWVFSMLNSKRASPGEVTTWGTA